VIVVSLASLSDRTAWDAYVASRADAVGYHEWGWREVFERAFAHRTLYLMARRDGHQVAGVLPLVEIRSVLFGRSITSLPFLNFGGVLASCAEAERALLNQAGALAIERKCPHVEFRHIGRHFDDLPCKQHKVTMRLDLQSSGPAGSAVQAVWERIDRKARNQVRKAEKLGLTAVRGGAELLPDFYRVFTRNMRDLGTPVYGPELFSHVLQTFPGRARLIVVRLNQAPIAAGFTYRTRGMTEIPWASSIRDFNNMCPNHLLYWHAIAAAVEEGSEIFDFGRSTPNEGTFKFKEQWGAKPVALHWEYLLASAQQLPDVSPRNPKFRLLIEAWKRLPLWLANAVGPGLARNIP
jgi:serine/alanine adding enzyme